MPKTYLYNGRSLKSAGTWTQQTLQEFLNDDNDDERLAMTPYSAYALVPWVRRCITLRAGAIANMPFALTAHGAELEPETIAAMPMTANLPALLNRIEQAVCIYGSGYLLKQNNGYMTNGLQWALPSLMTPYYNLVTGELEYIIRNANNKVENVPLDELVYFFEPALNSELAPGTSLTRTALVSAGLARYADRMVSGYFERGAVGTTILTVEGPTDDAESKRLENWWKKTTAGISKMFGTIAVRLGIKVNQLVPLIKDLMVPELTENARAQIAVTYGVPQTMLEDAANYATAVEHRLSFYQETILPRCEWYKQVLNEQLFKPMGMELTFRPEELDVFQEDEEQRSSSLGALVSAGFPVDLAAEILGYDLTDEQWARLKEEANKPEPQPVILSRGGAENADGEGTEDKQKEPAEDELDEDAKAEVKTWRRYALKHGAEKALGFECAHVPAELADSIRERLKAAGDEAALKAVFDGDAEAVKAKGGVDPNAAYKAEAEQRLFRLFKARLGDQFEDVMKTLGEPPDWSRLTEEFWKTQAGKMLSGIRPAIQQIAQDAATEMMAGGIGVDWTLVAEQAAQWTRTYAYDLIKGITDVTRKGVQQAVEDFIRTPGLTMGDLQASLEHLFSPIRAEMISVTETTRAYAQGEVEAAKEAKAAGINLVPYWNTNADDLVCPNCGPLNGKPTSEIPPKHPNCRCWLTHKWEPAE